jgi:hypothetical protein
MANSMLVGVGVNVGVDVGVGVLVGVGQGVNVGVNVGEGVALGKSGEAVPGPVCTGDWDDSGGIGGVVLEELETGEQAITPIPVVMPSNTIIISISHLPRLCFLPKNSAAAASGPMIAPVGSQGT